MSFYAKKKTIFYTSKCKCLTKILPIVYWTNEIIEQCTNEINKRKFSMFRKHASSLSQGNGPHVRERMHVFEIYNTLVINKGVYYL